MTRASLFVLPLSAVLLTALPATAAEVRVEASLTIRLIATPGRLHVKDVPPKGLPAVVSVGDTISGTSMLRNAVAQFDKPKGALVGSDSYVTTVTAAPSVQTRATARLPGGTLSVRGRASYASRKVTIPVVGGTGVFSGASGTYAASPLSGRRSLNVYRLRLS